jgi:hypothetical protein
MSGRPSVPNNNNKEDRGTPVSNDNNKKVHDPGQTSTVVNDRIFLVYGCMRSFTESVTFDLGIHQYQMKNQHQQQQQQQVKLHQNPINSKRYDKLKVYNEREQKKIQSFTQDVRERREKYFAYS